jgi:uncharacterized damage-inducible protein DinB
MAWANATLFARLADLPDEALQLAAPRNEWSMALILAHLVTAAGNYAARLEGAPYPEPATAPTRVADLAALASHCAAYDVRIRTQASVPDGPNEYPGKVRRARSTILGQAIHHATEHRAQIAGALATNGIDTIDLDALDVWAYSDAEGLGA